MSAAPIKLVFHRDAGRAAEATLVAVTVEFEGREYTLDDLREGGTLQLSPPDTWVMRTLQTKMHELARVLA